MKILVTNDDGIYSAGIAALVEALKEMAEVIVVAPSEEQSAVGHGITMKYPLRVFKYHKNGNFFGYAVEGTPADCVKMGIRNIMGESPDLVISGINHGSNTAINIIYSGTVSAAREAAIMDVPAIAISVTSHEAKDFKYAGKVAKYLSEKIVRYDLPRGTLMNVNVPNIPEEEIAGILVTKQSKAKWDDIYEKRTDPFGKDYYWLTGKLVEVENENQTDQSAIKNKYVSVTPIHFDLTDYDTYEKMKNWGIEKNNNQNAK